MWARRLLRWTAFLCAGGTFFYFVRVDNEDLRVLAGFFVSGGLWLWLERRKMRELDALIKK
ncbi:hypothetical protein EPO15_14640 [bacterium]|nr:MAG: hypothetical protein EPO15_14640 [bacterium]